MHALIWVAIGCAVFPADRDSVIDFQPPTPADSCCRRCLRRRPIAELLPTSWPPACLPACSYEESQLDLGEAASALERWGFLLTGPAQHLFLQELALVDYEPPPRCVCGWVCG